MPRRNVMTTTAALLALTALSGCGKHDTSSPAAGSSGPVDVAKSVDIAAANVHPRAGRWEATVKINRIDMPGMPPQMRDAMQTAMSREPMATCLTPEQAARPAAAFFSGQRNSCTYDKFTMDGGKLDAVMQCSAPSMHMQMTMTGTYSETSYDIHDTSTAALPGGKTMTQDMNVTSKWVGPCTGNEVNAGHKG